VAKGIDKALVASAVAEFAVRISFRHVNNPLEHSQPPSKCGYCRRTPQFGEPKLKATVSFKMNANRVAGDRLYRVCGQGGDTPADATVREHSKP
jgi:hypothetical protein